MTPKSSIAYYCAPCRSTPLVYGTVVHGQWPLSLNTFCSIYYFGKNVALEVSARVSRFFSCERAGTLLSCGLPPSLHVFCDVVLLLHTVASAPCALAHALEPIVFKNLSNALVAKSALAPGGQNHSVKTFNCFSCKQKIARVPIHVHHTSNILQSWRLPDQHFTM